MSSSGWPCRRGGGTAGVIPWDTERLSPALPIAALSFAQDSSQWSPGAGKCRVQQEQWMHGCHSLSQSLFLRQFVPVNSRQTSNPLGENRNSTYPVFSAAFFSHCSWHTGSLEWWWPCGSHGTKCRDRVSDPTIHWIRWLSPREASLLHTHSMAGPKISEPCEACNTQTKRW